MSVYDAGRRRAALAREVRERVRDGWMVLSRSGFEVMMVHSLRPPWWLMVLDFLFPVSVGHQAERYLHIEAFEGGELFRVSVGDVPRGWPSKRSWEVADGPVEAMSVDPVERPGEHRGDAD